MDWSIAISLCSVAGTGVALIVGWRSDNSIKKTMADFTTINRDQSGQVNALIQQSTALTDVLNRMARIVESQLQGGQR